jgi:amino acid transporter
MIGAGIFSILGVVAQVSGSALPASFTVGGVVALLAAYSYMKLGVRYPSVGGAVQFLVQGFGDGILSGALNIFQYIGYVIALALYANGFAGYAVTFLPHDAPSYFYKIFAVGIVLFFTFINFLGAAMMGKAETWIVAFKVLILIGFVAAGIAFIEPARLAVSTWPPASHIFFGAGVLFIGYEGFGLVTNAAGDMSNPQRQLPRALAISVLAVLLIYVTVAITAIGNLSLPQLIQAKDYALAEAAQPFLGKVGFKLIAVAALASTASAVNATLFGAANVSYQIAKDGQLPAMFTRQLWNRNVEGLFITTALVLVFVLFFNLAPIAMMGSAAFLIVYAAVNGAHWRIRRETGGNPWIIGASFVTCVVMFVFLIIYIKRTQPIAATIALLGSFVLSFLIEWIYRKQTKRTLQKIN